ncbi:2OG-Fe(II) oxygenase [Aurantimonas sp. VKM B-3413]|uniref:2OG-Fe(II) oxygenase n=1 Tax=Aurantimonas sp. VKM B-3413 TaxID=2779401 RepID=UPI00351D94DB|nr:2OG-Fe(II) oxygenase [Aurantimonas sp. VKM B-3413]
MTGHEQLVPDPTFRGGGLHCTGRNGSLLVHADADRHPNGPAFMQCLNLIVFLNRDWRTEFAGDLQLWARDGTRCVKSIKPDFNRAVLFESKGDTYHGHPEPLACPEGVFRLSLATYYYRVRLPDADSPPWRRQIDWLEADA